MGAILAQPDGKADYPVYFASRRFSKAEQGYSTTEREALGMVLSATKFRHYLLGKLFHFYVGHQALLYLINKNDDGTEAVVPLEFAVLSLRMAEQYDMDFNTILKKRLKDLHRLDEIRQRALLEQQIVQQQRTKYWRDSKIKVREFKQGDLTDEEEEDDEDKDDQAGTSGHQGPRDDNDDDQDQPGTVPRGGGHKGANFYLKVKDIEGVVRAVLPKFYADDIHPESWRVFSSCCFNRCIVTANPRIVVEFFCKNHLGADKVLGSEIQLTKGGRATGLLLSPGVLSRAIAFSSLATLYSFIALDLPARCIHGPAQKKRGGSAYAQALQACGVSQRQARSAPHPRCGPHDIDLVPLWQRDLPHTYAHMREHVPIACADHVQAAGNEVDRRGQHKEAARGDLSGGDDEQETGAATLQRAVHRATGADSVDGSPAQDEHVSRQHDARIQGLHARTTRFSFWSNCRES
ncbi:hypothetical protein L7F22_032503 [Adiantum nelumboides]|nr:hypothetical protein [Adiantum nelumboides]